MAIFYPISAAILQSGSMTFDKLILSVKKMNYKDYIGISFPLIFLFTLIIFLIFHPKFNPEFFQLKYYLLIIALVVIILITNILYYRALKRDMLSEMQTISLLKGIPLIIFAALIFPNERNPIIIILSLIAIAAIIWSHYEHHHFKIFKKTLPFLLWILTIGAFAGIINKLILDVLNPITMQLITDGAIALILTPLYFKDIKSIPKKSLKKALPLLLLTNLLTSIAFILYYFSFQLSGIIYTVLIFSIQPVLVYFISLIFLKEKFHIKKFLAFIIILIVIILSQVIK
jgi:drug/metabolite transporter (DMT)-like permease